MQVSIQEISKNSRCDEMCRFSVNHLLDILYLEYDTGHYYSVATADAGSLNSNTNNSNNKQYLCIHPEKKLRSRLFTKCMLNSFLVCRSYKLRTFC